MAKLIWFRLLPAVLIAMIAQAFERFPLLLAQDVIIVGEVPPGVAPQIPPGVVPPPNLRSGPSTTNAPAPPNPEEQRLQALLKLQFDRRPQSILQALAKQAEGGSVLTNETQRFQNDVIAGNWKAVGEFLARLPEKQAPVVYKYLLEGVQKLPQPGMSGGMPQGMEQPPMMAPQPGMPGVQPAPVLLPDDVLALADIAPGELTDEQAELLGKLLSLSLSKGNFIDPLLAKLEAGTKRLGGQDPRKRNLAATFLIAANRLTDAGNFLPALEPALDKKEIKTLDLHARYLMAIAAQPQATGMSASLRQAWDITQAILSATNSPAKEREQALSRALDLMPRLTKELGANWLRQNFQQKPEQGMALIAAVGTLVTQNLANRDTEARRRNLELQRRTVDALLAAAAKETKPWEPALNLLVLSWVQEADYSKARYAPPRPQYQQYDMYGNPNFYDGGPYGPGIYQDPNQLQPVPIDKLLPTAPSDDWLETMEKSLVPRVRVLMAELHLKIEEEQKALPYIELVAPEQPRAALALANDLLRIWTRTHNPNQNMMNRYGQYGPVYYGMGSPYGMNPQGIPLTRAMQARNLKELSDLLKRLRALPAPPLDEKLVVAAFAAAHSQAEVFRVEDIESVFGPLDKMNIETGAEILQTMRQRLAGQWRQPRVQQDAKTKRTDKEVDAEIVRGYELVAKLIQTALDRHPHEWRLHLVQGATLFDWAEFDYGKKVDLAIYTAKRDKAFDAFLKATELYAQEVPVVDEKEQSPLVYQQWFNSTLGASDLAYLTRQQEPSTNHLEKIRQAILALPADAVERHLAAFGKSLSESAATLKPELKPRYLRAGLRVVGDHPSAADARKLVTYYDDLLNEVVLHTQVDGDAAVGHTQPFGVFVSIRYSTAMGRESGGFAKYLQNQQNQGYFYNPYGQAPVNYRDEFEKQVKEKLGETFEILSVTFHEDKVQARGTARPNWRETPYAYLLIKAKDGAADRIPALQLDIDFFDKRGQVVLPIVSQVQWLDARPDSVPRRPASKIKVTEILDQRQLAAGKLTIEIKSTANGLLPELKEMFDLKVAGFKADKVSDQGLAVVKMDTEGDQVAPVCERNGLINLSQDLDAAAATTTFRFPAPKFDGMEVTYKKYADADLVEVKPEVALAGVQLKPRPVWQWVWSGVAGILALGVLTFWLRRKQKTDAVEQTAAYTLPAQITPFTVLNLLRRMYADDHLPLNDERRGELARMIQDLEKLFFSRSSGGSSTPNLEQIARQWLACVK